MVYDNDDDNDDDNIFCWIVPVPVPLLVYSECFSFKIMYTAYCKKNYCFINKLIDHME